MLSLFTHTMFAAVILSLTLGFPSFPYALFRFPGLAVAMPCMVQGDQNLFLFDEFNLSRTLASSYGSTMWTSGQARHTPFRARNSLQKSSCPSKSGAFPRETFLVCLVICPSFCPKPSIGSFCRLCRLWQESDTIQATLMFACLRKPPKTRPTEFVGDQSPSVF